MVLAQGFRILVYDSFFVRAHVLRVGVRVRLCVRLCVHVCGHVCLCVCASLGLGGIGPLGVFNVKVETKKVYQKMAKRTKAQNGHE